MIVMKFGGSSVADASRIRHVMEIVKTQFDRKPVLVLSAMGDTTDHLLEAGDKALKDGVVETALIKKLHMTTIKNLKLPIQKDIDIALYSTDGRALAISTALLAPKATRSTQGVQVMAVKKRHSLQQVIPLEKSFIENQARYKVRTIPAAGALLKPEDRGEKQMEL